MSLQSRSRCVSVKNNFALDRSQTRIAWNALNKQVGGTGFDFSF